MAARYLSWSEAFRLFADHLVQFQKHRSGGLDVAQAGAALGISAEAAEAYEDLIVRLMADLKNEAAPDSTRPGRPAAAPEKAQTDNTEGVTAP